MKPQQRFDQILLLALKNEATDIHFIKCDFNIDIQMRTISGFKKIINEEQDYNLFQYIKYLANLELTDSLKPQTGTFTYQFQNQKLFLRFAILNTDVISSGVLRILYQKVINDNISHFHDQNRIFNQIVKKNAGLIVLSGPTGSGKTSSGYSLLHKIKQKKIFTIEDPIEMMFNNIVQLQVNKEKNITYETGLKQLLRHDPDVIYIGEIRDNNEANMAIRSALTGHLVITTIHAKDCLGVIQRMADLKVNMLDFYQTIIMITNQRLYPMSYLKERICLYEIMDETEISYYQKNKVLSPNFKSLSKYFEMAKNKKIIAKKTSL